MKKTKKGEPEFISGSELARRLGVSKTAIRKAVESGRIIPAFSGEGGRRLFDEATARQQWGKNTLQEKSTGRQTVSAAPDRSFDNMDPNEARAARDSAHARILTFKAKTLEQELVPFDDVARLWESHVGEAKRLFLMLPAELRMLIPALTADNIALIESRIVAILDTLSAWHPGEKV